MNKNNPSIQCLRIKAEEMANCTDYSDKPPPDLFFKIWGRLEGVLIVVISSLAPIPAFPHPENGMEEGDFCRKVKLVLLICVGEN
jgi:hypothetical protein